MLIHVQLKLLVNRKDNPISSGYRSPWFSKQEEPNLEDKILGTACLYLQRPFGEGISPGILEPLVPDLWSSLKVDDYIEGRDGRLVTFHAKVCRILKDI